jgi:4-hydroxyphenylpyruvate dioxygenase
MEIDSIHFYVVDANRTRDLLIAQMGLQALDSSRLSCGQKPSIERACDDTTVYLVGNNHLWFSISSPLNSTSPVADYLQLHPSGVKDVSFRVTALDEIRQKVDRLGIKVLAGSSDLDELQWIVIQGWGAIEHTIIEAASPANGADKSEPPAAILGIDHIVLNVAAGELASATNWYRDLFGFQVQQTFEIQTSKSGLASKALISACGQIRFNINEPSSSNSQIQEFLDLNCGAGIQHIALQTSNILTTIAQMQQHELAFLPIPNSYYINLQTRATIEQSQLLTTSEWQQIEQLQILMDWSASAPEDVLLQIFTQPIFESPTFFFEVIERRNRAQGFGQGNFQALFEAIEQYQDSAPTSA